MTHLEIKVKAGCQSARSNEYTYRDDLSNLPLYKTSSRLIVKTKSYLTQMWNSLICETVVYAFCGFVLYRRVERVDQYKDMAFEFRKNNDAEAFW